MSDLQVTVLRRNGKVRLQVSNGMRRIGWYDLETGEHSLDVPQRAAAFWTAVHRERDRDLASTKAGAAAQAQAAELRRQRPLGSGLARILRIRTKAGDFAFGTRGERVIGRKLDRWARRGGWQVLHAIPVGQDGANVDHILIGGFGVVTINTKRTRGAVWAGEHAMMLNGAKVDYLRDSRRERERVGKLLEVAHGSPVPVSTAIVFVGARRFTVRDGGPRDIAVHRNARALRRWLRRRGTVLAPDRVTAIYELARNPVTWKS